MTDAERTLIHEALRFAVWAAGKGIAPAKGEDARGPEDFLFDYSLETDETDWETLPDRIIAAMEAQLAALPKPDMVSMSEGTIHLDYEDDDARREAYEWLERYAYSSAPEVSSNCIISNS